MKLEVIIPIPVKLEVSTLGKFEASTPGKLKVIFLRRIEVDKILKLLHWEHFKVGVQETFIFSIQEKFGVY